VSIDLHRPVAHLRPPRNWINDPNGLVFHDGYYHVCYQYNPFGARHANMHWGHFRSPDLLSWEALPLALTPTPGGEDADGCFSGNAVSDGDRLIAFYSANRQDRWSQPVTTATSYDGGHTFRARGDLLIPEVPEGLTMYRDPYVWRDGDGWRMLVGAALSDGRAAALLYESPDLEAWNYLGPFHASESRAVREMLTGEGWECPQFLPAGSGRGALIVSAWDDHDGPRCVVAMVGDVHGDRFEPGPPALLDYGPDCYAPALLRGPGDRWLLWGWSWEARDEVWSDEDGWAGVLTIPREITVVDGEVFQRPAEEVLALRGEQLELGEVPRSFDLEATGEGILRLVTGADEYLEIRLAAGEVVVDRDHASLDPRARGGSYRMPCPSGELRVVVDRSIAEIFTATGQVLTVRFYPVGDGPWRLEAQGFAVDAWELQPLKVS
jgi:beta-fructofuranosidase